MNKAFSLKIVCEQTKIKEKKYTNSQQQIQSNCRLTLRLISNYVCIKPYLTKKK